MGGMELLIILVIVLLFFGAKRVPELGRSLGRGMREIRKGASEDNDSEDERREGAESKELPRHEAEPPLASKEEEMPRSREEPVARYHGSRYRDL